MSVTTIEWTKRPGTVGETWNPTTGCNKVDRGCKNCYAEVMHYRLQAMGQPKYAAEFLGGAIEHPETLAIPFSWKKPRTVFVNSMSDLFHPAVSFEFIASVFGVMDSTPEHTYLVLTKRPERALEFWEWMTGRLPGSKAFSCPANVWMGTSVHDQESLNKRGPHLAQLDCTVRFLSAEPLLGPLVLPADANDGSGYFEWVICGGESGPHAQPMNPAWVRQLRDQCAALGAAFFFKQYGMWQLADELPPQQPGEKRRCCYAYHGGTSPTKYVRRPKKRGNLLDGKQHQAFPS